MASGSVERVAPAKINLYLSVLGRRPDGYHDLDTVFVPLDLGDQVRVDAADPGVLEVDCVGRPDLCGEANLVHQALARYRALAGAGVPGFRARIQKDTPVAAGLGGGSSDAAAALLAAQELCGAPVADSDLHLLATELGADVPCFLVGGPSWGRGKGELLEPIDDLPDLPLVLVAPDVAVSTAEVFAEWDQAGNQSLTRVRPSDTKPRFFESVAHTAQRVNNDLEELTKRRVPAVGRALQGLAAAGALASAMSGSGPAVFGLFANVEAATVAARQLESSTDGIVRVVRGLGQSH